MDDWELLQDYAKRRSEAAFTELVQRHLAWVYSAALRQVGSPQLAEEVAQSVFVLLAQKAEKLNRQTIVGGWLFRTTRFVAARALRAERRRQCREQTAPAMLAQTNSSDENEILWDQVAPHLDQAVAALSEPDRSAILMRFYEKKPLSEIGERLGVSEDAAKKRVSRAVDKLRKFLGARGMTLAATSLAALLAGQTVQALPAILKTAVIKTSLASMSPAATLPHLASDTLNAWRWAKLKLAAGIVALSLTCVFVGFNPGLWHVGSTPRVSADQAIPVAEQIPTGGTDSGAPPNAAAKSNPGNVQSLLFVVRDAVTGGIIPEAEIHASYAVNREWVQNDDLSTDSEGQCWVPIPSGNLARLDLAALKDGYEEKFVTWMPVAGDPVPLTYTLRLRKAIPMGGWVRDESGEPVAGAEIIVQFAGTSDGHAREPGGERLGFIHDLTVARSDTAGRWLCGVVPPGLERSGFSLRAQHPGYLRGGDGDITMETLRQKEAVLVLRRGAPITGLVIDNQDHPVAGAQVWAGAGQEPAARSVTDQSGRFVLDKLEAGWAVTVLAEGFTADQQEVDSVNSSAPLQFRLAPAPRLRFRVIDEAGQPVHGCELALENWWGRRHSIEFRRATDGAGRLEWLAAPKGELEFCVLKGGYRTSRQNRLVADGEEHTIVLRRVLTVTGSVTDAETAEPLGSFKAIPGYSQHVGSGMETQIIWDRSERQFGANGFYKLVIKEENVAKVRIEAEGYEIAELQPPLDGSLESTCDFQLRRLDTNRFLRGTVLLPDGTPAVGVEVALCTYQCGVLLKGTTFQKTLFGNGIREPLDDYRSKTDQRGSFSFGPKPRAHTVVAVGPAGLGTAHCYDWTQPLQIRLQAWGRIVGAVRTRDHQWAGRKIVWSPRGELFEGMTLFHENGVVSATSDADGQFTLENVPPGIGQIAILEATTDSRICLTPVELPSGKTVEVQVGGTGLTVSGRLVAASGTEVRSWRDQIQVAQLDSEWSLPAPKNVTGEAMERWRQEWPETEAGRAWFRERRTYDLKVQPDGSFVLPEVLPGNYRLIVHVREGSLSSAGSSTSSQSNRQIALLGQKILVPDAATGANVRLGDLVLTPSPVPDAFGSVLRP